jgi:hypothetical protein
MLLSKLKEEEDRKLKSQGTVSFFLYSIRERREREKRELSLSSLLFSSSSSLLLFFFFTSRARTRNSIPSNPFVCQRRDATFAELNESQIQESLRREKKQTFSCVNFFARDGPDKKTSLSRPKVTTQRLDRPSERGALREGTGEREGKVAAVRERKPGLRLRGSCSCAAAAKKEEEKDSRGASLVRREVRVASDMPEWPWEKKQLERARGRERERASERERGRGA